MHVAEGPQIALLARAIADPAGDGECLLEVVGGRSVPALQEVDGAEAAQRLVFARAVADLPGDGQRLLEVVGGRPVPAVRVGDQTQAAQRALFARAVAGVAMAQRGVDAIQSGRLPFGFQCRAHRGRPRGVQIGERRTAPPPQGLIEQCHRAGVVTRRARLGEQAAEPLQVHRCRVDGELVAAGAPLDSHVGLGRERGSQPREVAVEDIRATWRVLVPDPFDEL